MKAFYCNGKSPKLRSSESHLNREETKNSSLSVEKAIRFMSVCVHSVYTSDYNGTKELDLNLTQLAAHQQQQQQQEFSCNEPHYGSYIYKVRQVQIWADGIFLTTFGKYE